MNTIKHTAETIARERLEHYLVAKLTDALPESAWEFYTFLLTQAKNHEVDYSGFSPAACQEDEAEARRRNAALSESPNTFHLPERCRQKTRFF